MAGGVGQPLPDVVLGDFALVVAVEHVDDADPFQRYRGEVADGDVHDGAAEARGDGAEDGAGRFGGHVDYVAVDGIVQPGHQQAFGFGFGELVIRVLPDVVHAAGGQAHQEAAILAAADAGAYQVVEREGGIERHVGFILVLAQPGGHIGVAVITILVEDHHHAAHLAMDLLEVAHVDALFVPLADGLAEVDAIQNRSSEGLDAHAFLGENALALLLEVASVVLDDEVFGGIGADARAIQLAGPFAGELLFFARLEAVGAQFLLGVGQAAAQADAAGGGPDLFARGGRGGDVAFEALRRIESGGLPDIPGVVVVGDAAGGHGEIDDAGREIVSGEGEIARIAGQQAALPVGDALAGIGLVLLLGGAQDGELRVAAIDQVEIGHEAAKGLVAPLEGGVFEQDFGQRFGMRVEQFDAFAAGARHRLRLRFLHGIQHRVEQVERDHYQDSGKRVGALEFPSDSGGMAREFVRTRLRIDAIGPDIP